MAYRVDNVPLLLQPPFLLFAHGTAVLSEVFRLSLNKSCKIVIEGDPHPAPFKNHIYAAWHENLLAYFTMHLRYNEPYVWLNHPLWFMKPIHLMLYKMGTEKLFLGSSGHGGRAAMEKVVEHVQSGYNTFINPDGPAGPPRVLKNGVLEMSMQTGIPVIPLKFELSKSVRIPGWDRKKMPLPFSTIKMIYQKPVMVTEENFDEAREEITRLMG